jgi:hypothetical protein
MIRIFLGILLFVYTMIAYASTSPIAIGSLGYVYPQTRPMILVGNDQGQSWTFVKDISNLPANLQEAAPLAVSCQGNNCVIAGEYNDSQPLLLFSKDKRESWVFTNNISGIPSDYDVNYLSTLACSNDTCLTGGFADKRGYHSEPQDFILLLQSRDRGKSWSRVNGGLLVNLKNKRGAIHDITRSGNHWIAVGNYVTREFPRIPWVEWPFVLVSKDNGTSWSFLTKYAGLPSSVSGSFSTVHCSNNICLAGGTGGYAGDNGLPFLFRSDNNGESWSSVKNISGFPPGPMPIINGPNLHAFNCSDSTCVAIGDWGIDESPNGVPILLVSHDHGQSFITIEFIAGLPSNVKYPLLRTVHCSNTTCLAGGYYDRDSNSTGLPLLLISKDKGLSWSLVKDIIGLPKNFKDASISSVTCSGNECTAIGDWKPFTPSETYLPLLLSSKDGGQSWSFVQNIIDLPANMERGLLIDQQ